MNGNNWSRIKDNMLLLIGDFYESKVEKLRIRPSDCGNYCKFILA